MDLRGRSVRTSHFESETEFKFGDNLEIRTDSFEI